eukprot:417452_1
MKKNDTKMDTIDDGNESQSSIITCTAYGTNAGEDTVIVKGGKAMVFCNNDCGWLRQMYCVMDCLVFVYVLLYIPCTNILNHGHCDLRLCGNPEGILSVSKVIKSRRH